MWGVAQARVAAWNYIMGSNQRVKAAQQRVMKKIVRVAQETDYGSEYGFSDVHDYATWQKRAPETDYDKLEPYFRRMMHGERDVLVNGFVKYFGNSSGTSTGGKQKFLPISDAQIALQKKASTDLVFRYLVAKNDRDFTNGFSIGVFPPTVMKRQDAVIVSNNPAIMFDQLPPIARPVTIPKGDIKREENLQKKQERIANEYLFHNVHAASGTTCWFSLLFDEVIAAAQRRGLRADTVGDVWPNLRVLFGGGVVAEPYLPIIRERVGHDITMVDNYNATEGGIFACSDFSGDSGMLMLPDRGVFFEFIELDAHGKRNRERIPLWEVEANKNYSLIISTVSGFYAYEIGDIVRFTSTQPYRMAYAGRLNGCLSTTQELTTHIEIQNAVDYALKEQDARSLDFGCGADVGVDGSAKARYALFIEFDSNDTPNIERFSDDFDRELQRINRVYREHRSDDLGILPPEVVALKRGTSRKFVEALNLGAQAKFPRILRDEQRDLMRSLL